MDEAIQRWNRRVNAKDDEVIEANPVNPLVEGE